MRDSLVDLLSIWFSKTYNQDTMMWVISLLGNAPIGPNQQSFFPLYLIPQSSIPPYLYQGCYEYQVHHVLSTAVLEWSSGECFHRRRFSLPNTQFLNRCNLIFC